MRGQSASGRCVSAVPRQADWRRRSRQPATSLKLALAPESRLLVFLLYYRELSVLEVGDQHRARRVRDREQRLDVRDDRLGRDAAGPEHRKLRRF